MLHQEAARLVVAPEARAERREIDLIRGFAVVAAVHEGVQGGQFAHHLRDHIVQFLAVRHPIHQRQVARADGVPVHAVHVAVVEIIALQPPRIHEDAAKIRARIGGEGPAR